MKEDKKEARVDLQMDSFTTGQDKAHLFADKIGVIHLKVWLSNVRGNIFGVLTCS